MEWFLHSGTAAARLVRTLVEVVLSWLVASLGDIFGLFSLDPTVKALIISMEEKSVHSFFFIQYSVIPG